MLLPVTVKERTNGPLSVPWSPVHVSVAPSVLHAPSVYVPIVLTTELKMCAPLSSVISIFLMLMAAASGPLNVGSPIAPLVLMPEDVDAWPGMGG